MILDEAEMILYQAAVLIMLFGFFALVTRNLREYPVLDERLLPPRPTEKLFFLIPARNEANNIEQCLESVLSQNWRTITVFVLDDGSDDGTGALVARIASQDDRVHLIAGQPIPEGWAGKVWACHQLGERALAEQADWLLFIDADTRVSPETAQAALAYAQSTNAGMVSAFPYQVTGSFSETVVLPMIQFLIVTFLPVSMVWSAPNPNIVAACGQFELFSAEAYQAIGGHGSIPGSFHDGLQLARSMKRSGRTVRLFDGTRLVRCHMYDGARAVWNGFTRNAYEGLGGFGPLVVMTGLQFLVFLMPFVWAAIWLAIGVATGKHPLWGWLCVIQVAVILGMRAIQARRFGHPISVLLHPLSVLAMVVIQWASFWKRLRKRPVVWKGRAY